MRQKRRKDETDAPFQELPFDDRRRDFSRIMILDEPVERDAPEKQGHFADRRARICLVLCIILPLLILVCILLPNNVFSLNNTTLSFAWWIDVFQTNVSSFVTFILGQGTPNSIHFVVFRFLILALAGAALGLSGAVYQGSLRNALASPSTLGVMSGAMLGVTIYSLFFVSTEGDYTIYEMRDLIEAYDAMSFWDYLLEMQTPALAAIIGALAVAGFVVGVAWIAGHGHISGLALIITGQVVMALISAFNQVVRYYLAYTDPGGTRSESMRYLQTAAFDSTFTAWDLISLAVPVVVILVIILALRSRINLLAFDETEAASMGIATTRLRIIVVCCTTVLTAVVVAFCGQIGFLGFFIPHITRRLIGPDFRYLLPASALCGAIFLVAAYYLTTMFDMAAASGLGLFTSIIGAIVFFALLLRERGRLNDDWL